MLKRQNSTEAGINLKNLTYSHRKIRMQQTNYQAHRVNILNFSKFKLGEHYQLAHSIIDPSADLRTEKNIQAFRQNSIYRNKMKNVNLINDANDNENNNNKKCKEQQSSTIYDYQKNSNNSRPSAI